MRLEREVGGDGGLPGGGGNRLGGEFEHVAGLGALEAPFGMKVVMAGPRVRVGMDLGVRLDMLKVWEL